MTVVTGRTAIDLLTLSHHSSDPLDVYQPPTCVGAYVFDQETGQVETVLARRTILATGGLGRIYLHTTNPHGACGDGVAMAYRAGRALSQHAVRPVPPDDALPPGRTLPDLGIAARRGRAAGGRARPGIHDRATTRPARWRRATSSRAASTR